MSSASAFRSVDHRRSRHRKKGSLWPMASIGIGKTTSKQRHIEMMDESSRGIGDSVVTRAAKTHLDYSRWSSFIVSRSRLQPPLRSIQSINTVENTAGARLDHGAMPAPQGDDRVARTNEPGSIRIFPSVRLRSTGSRPARDRTRPSVNERISGPATWKFNPPHTPAARRTALRSE